MKRNLCDQPNGIQWIHLANEYYQWFVDVNCSVKPELNYWNVVFLFFFRKKLKIIDKI